jgi:hypothetical protein
MIKKGEITRIPTLKIEKLKKIVMQIILRKQ